ncbi:MAG: hypothetical protein ACI8WT_004877 [Clostridium sp.]|jgi:hypothetical protein
MKKIIIATLLICSSVLAKEEVAEVTYPTPSVKGDTLFNHIEKYCKRYEKYEVKVGGMINELAIKRSQKLQKQALESLFNIIYPILNEKKLNSTRAIKIDFNIEMIAAEDMIHQAEKMLAQGKLSEMSDTPLSSVCESVLLDKYSNYI